MTVRELKALFREKCGATLRVYQSTSCRGPLANDDDKLTFFQPKLPYLKSITVADATTVGDFEKKVASECGIGVQVANADDTKLVDNKFRVIDAGRSR